MNLEKRHYIAAISNLERRIDSLKILILSEENSGIRFQFTKSYDESIVRLETLKVALETITAAGV